MRYLALIPVGAWLAGCGTTVIGEGVDAGNTGGSSSIPTTGGSNQTETGGTTDTGGQQATGGTLGTSVITLVGGVNSAGGAPSYGGVTSALGGSTPVSAGGQQANGGALGSGGTSAAASGGQQATGGASTAPVTIAGCGDGILYATEECDDANQLSGDGCSSTCKVETGWQCRKPGQHCVPLCGDSKKVGGETCDDGNKESSDGCSSACLTEPGYTCTGTGPGSCSASICGNGTVEPGEACDCGNDPKNLRAGCKGSNGFFFGDGTGCSKTCTKEPTCTRNDPAGCASVCGDGNVSGNEKCDDGNTFDGDGCKGDCSGIEYGFMCDNKTISDTEACPSNPSLSCLVLPVVYRDFEGQNVSGGHPDFFYVGATVTGGRTVGVTPGATKTTCVPNAYGVPSAFTDGGQCPANDQSGPCTGLVATNLDTDGKPVMARQKCHCIFTDWDNTGVLGTCAGGNCSGGITGAQTCSVEGSGDKHYRIETDVNVFQNADSFKQWYTDSDFSTRVLGTLELAGTSGGLYQFSSSRPGDPAGTPSRLRVDDLHDACLATPHNATLSSGFFPLEDQPSHKICNLNSYWMTGVSTATDSTCCAGTGCPVRAQFDPLASADNCPMEGTGGWVPKSDGTGGRITGMTRNFYFTSEVRYLFRYDGKSARLVVNGDDDIWVFINGILAVDLGGTHERASKDVNIDGATYKLTSGNTYEIVAFQANRSPVESNFQLSLSGFSTVRTECAATCGDGRLSGAEECDLGSGMNNGEYDGCNDDCTYGPFCGDGIVNGPEECDDVLNLTMTYDPNHPGGCHPGCTLPRSH